jgi:hypothetical protein
VIGTSPLLSQELQLHSSCSSESCEIPDRPRAEIAIGTPEKTPVTRPNVGAGEGTRTPNLLFTRQLRYRLRHASMTDISPRWRCSSRRARSPHQAATSCWYVHSACDQVGGLVHGLLCDRTDPLLVGVGSDGECARPNISRYRSSGHPGGGRPRRQAARALRPVGRRRVEPFQPTGSR